MPNNAKAGEGIDKSLLEAIEASNVARASELATKNMRQGGDPWKIHLSLFPGVQRVLNPPFINPHLPKMYRISRELMPYLSKDKIEALVLLEITEYARRPKLEKLPRADILTSTVFFKDIETAIRENDPEKATVLMATFIDQKSEPEFARQLLLLGSGYLNSSLGHSVSCTAFILLEMLDRSDQDRWLALSALADYFCKGRFHTTPARKKSASFPPHKTPTHHMLQATSGRGIVNLHHTITRYAIERARKFFTPEDYDHMVIGWVEFLGDKSEEEVTLNGIECEPMKDYHQFYGKFSRLEAQLVVASLKGMASSEQGRNTLGRFLIQGLCDQYQGHYNPHYLTGLGSALWVLNQYWDHTPIAINALFQYLEFFFSDLKSQN